MPKSAYWTAPEWGKTGTRFSGAKKMDAYSFGMLCLWLLFFSTQGEGNDEGKNGGSFRNALQRRGPALGLASVLVASETRFDKEGRENLRELFRLTLERDPLQRSSDFAKFASLLGRWEMAG